MFRNLKLKFVSLALVAIVFTLFTQGTLAYFVAFGKSTNVVTSGKIQFIIHETTDQGKEFPKRGVYVNPGDVVSKQVRIENICAHPFYLRVKIVSGVEGRALSAEECFKLNIDETLWQYVDGWYYYTGIVQPGETTPNVFSEVKVAIQRSDERYRGETLTLKVVAHAVQSENNPVEGTNTYQALGWPQE